MSGDSFKSMGRSAPMFHGVGTAAARLGQDLASGQNVTGSLLNFGGSIMRKYALGQLPEMEQKIKTEQNAAGTKAGLSAAKAGDTLEYKDAQTIAGSAFNRGAEQSYLTALGLDIRAMADKQHHAFEADVAGFDAAWQQYSTKLLEKVPANLRSSLELELTARRGEKIRQIEGTFIQRQRGVQQATVLGGIEEFGRDYENAWRRGDGQSAVEAFTRFEGSIQGALESGLISPERAASLRSTLRAEGEKQTVLGQFERTLDRYGLDQGKDYIDRFKKSQSDMDPDLKDRIVAQLEGDLAGRVAEFKVQEAETEKMVDQYVEVLSRGHKPKGLEAFREKVKGTKHEAELLAAESKIEYFQTFAKLPQSQQKSVLAQQRSKKLNLNQSETLGLLEKAYEKDVEAWAKDPVARGIELELVTTKTLDFNNPQNLLEQMKARSLEVQKLERLKGTEMMVLTQQEIDGVSKILESSSAQGKVQTLSALNAGFGPENVRRLAKEFYPKNPDFAMASVISTKEPRVAEKILMGQDALAADPGLKPARIDFEMTAQDYLGDAFSAMPKAREQTVKAALSIYAGELQALGQSAEAFNPDRFEAALEAVTGGIIEFQDRQIVAPVRGMSESDFETFMSSLDENDLKDFSIGGEPPRTRGGKVIEPETLLNMGQLVPDGLGQFKVRLGQGYVQGSGPDGLYILRFDETAIKSRLSKLQGS